jgi:hypothetical protein
VFRATSRSANNRAHSAGSSGTIRSQAKSRAKKRLEEIEKQINIARSNYIQLGGKLDEAFSNEFKSEQNTIK